MIWIETSHQLRLTQFSIRGTYLEWPAPHYVKVCHQICDSDGIHTLQIDDISSGPTSLFSVAQPQRLVINKHGKSRSYSHSRSKGFREVLMQEERGHIRACKHGESRDETLDRRLRSGVALLIGGCI